MLPETGWRSTPDDDHVRRRSPRGEAVGEGVRVALASPPLLDRLSSRKHFSDKYSAFVGNGAPAWRRCRFVRAQWILNVRTCSANRRFSSQDLIADYLKSEIITFSIEKIYLYNHDKY